MVNNINKSKGASSTTDQRFKDQYTANLITKGVVVVLLCNFAYYRHCIVVFKEARATLEKVANQTIGIAHSENLAISPNPNIPNSKTVIVFPHRSSYLDYY